MHSKQGRSNNLVSDIRLNAYISYNVSWMKTWSRRSSGRRYHYTRCATWAIPGWSQNHHLHYFTHHLKHSDIPWFCWRGFLLWVLCGVKTIVRNTIVARMIWLFYSVQQTRKAVIMQLLLKQLESVRRLVQMTVYNVKMLTCVSKPLSFMTTLFKFQSSKLFVYVNPVWNYSDLSRVCLVFSQWHFTFKVFCLVMSFKVSQGCTRTRVTNLLNNV